MREGTDKDRKDKYCLPARCLLAVCLLMLILSGRVISQDGRSMPVAAYTIKNGRMYIVLDKKLDKIRLDKFIDMYGLSDLDLPAMLVSRHKEKLKEKGWKVEMDNPQRLVVSKLIGGIGQLENPEKRMALTEDHPNTYDLFPRENDDLVYGFNHFIGKFPFAVRDSLVTFFLKGHAHASQALLAGSFTNWQNGALTMTRTDSGWIAVVKLNAGKYWYKFIVDGRWMVDDNNYLKEDDRRGNMNSVYYKANVVLSLPGYTDAKDVYLTGNFNNWNPRELPMRKGPLGWTIRLYLAEGTFRYKFVVDGKWYEDPANAQRMPDGHKGFNSVLELGPSHLFSLNGYQSAGMVALEGSFNGWNPSDLPMHKTKMGWELHYALGPGSYQYRFVVDGKPITDPADSLFARDPHKDRVSSYLIIQPNYSFRLQGYQDARVVCVAGDFNDWTPDALKMKRVGDTWIFNVHLSVGKHLYKFIVDGHWIKDPDNPLWEGNQYNTDNSVIWMEDW